jgi:glycosyltransferase involved in cell wall biosynthesis
VTSPPRVAFVLGVATGGTAVHVAALAAGCRDDGLTVSVFAPPQTLSLVAASNPGIETFPTRISSGPRLAADLVTVARLRSGLARKRPDVVHAHGVRAGAFAALAVAAMRRADRPALAVTIHNAPPDGRAARLSFGLLERICVRRADLLLCASADLLGRMRALGGGNAEQFDVPAPDPEPPSAEAVAAARADVGGDERPVVLTVARLAAQKGLDVLIDAAASWRYRSPRPQTVIAGDGPLAGELRLRARQADADVLFLGTRGDVPALLAVADVVVLPSRWEARALILQEAMRSGVPVVATRVGGTPELTGDGALLVPPGDAAALAVAVTAVLDDPSLAARLRLAASAQAATFPSVKDAVRSAVAIYSRLASARIGQEKTAKIA